MVSFSIGQLVLQFLEQELGSLTLRLVLPKKQEKLEIRFPAVVQRVPKVYFSISNVLWLFTYDLDSAIQGELVKFTIIAQVLAKNAVIVYFRPGEQFQLYATKT